MSIGFLMRNPGFALGAPRRAASAIRAMREFSKLHGGKCRVTGLKGEVYHVESVKDRPDLADDPHNMIMLHRAIHRVCLHPRGWHMSLGKSGLGVVVKLIAEYDRWREDNFEEK
jgi:hypothetical protein